MFDTITIKPQYFDHSKISALIDTLDDATVKFRKDGTMLKTGSKGHVRLFLTYGTFSVNLNLNKLLYGTNEIDAPLSSLEDVLTSLEDWLGVDLHDAPVSRVDIGQTIVVTEEPYKYLELLAYCSRAKKIIYKGETVAFVNGSNEALFYDKGLEMKAKKVRPLTLQQNPNLLRFEARLKKGIKQTLKVPKLTAGMLMQSDIIEKLLTFWQNSYLKICKIVRPQANIDCSDTKSFIMSLANHAVGTLGIDTVLNHIDAESRKLTGTQRHRIKQKLFQLSSFNTDGSTQVLLDELSEKIQWIAANAA